MDVDVPEGPQRDFLVQVLDCASMRGPHEHALVLLDLDSTLYDNRPRTLRILREWATHRMTAHGEEARKVLSIRPEQQLYRLDQTLAQAGVADGAVHAEVIEFWKRRFFTDEYCLDDVPTAGALAYAQELHRRGLFLMYLTGRDVPGMLVGTISSLRRDGFPIGVAGTMLVMKPDFDTPDAVFKRDVLDHIAAIGQPVAAFDNEPENCNLFADRFPSCLVAMLDTMHSSGAPALRPEVTVLRDFVR